MKGVALMGGSSEYLKKLRRHWNDLSNKAFDWFSKSKKAISNLKSNETFSKFNINKPYSYKKTGNKKSNIKTSSKIKVVNKKRFTITAGALAAIFIIILYLSFANNAFAVLINGVEVAKVKKTEIAEEVLARLKQNFKELNDADIEFTNQISYKKINASKKELLEGKALEEQLKRHLDYEVKCAVIYADDKPVVTLKTKDEAESVLSAVEEYFLKSVNPENIKEKSYSEKVEIREEFVDISRVIDVEDAKNYVIKGTSEVRVHKVQSGESFWSISRKYNISLDDLEKANPGVNPERIQIGQELNLVVPKPLVSIKTVEEATYLEKIPYEQKLELSSSLYKDEIQVRVRGEYGEKEVKAEIIKINGIESERIVLAEKVIKEPKAQILVKGTKEPPPKKGTGTFTTPTRGTITSRYGARWGRNHNGIDIAAPIGTPVKAADGGEVIFAGTYGNYGKLIKIDHGAGFVTYYGHLSKINVKVGDKVYKGQTIGAVGKTGNSTGPHLHFEIRKNGTPVNPTKYLP